MSRKRIAIIASAVGVLAAGSAGAIAIADHRGDEAKQRETAILGDAAQDLNVSPDQLRTALRDAQIAQVDRAVREGRLTEQQGDRARQRIRESGLVLGGPGGRGSHHRRGGPHGQPGPHGGDPRAMMANVARALGLTPAELRRQFDAGRTVAQIAEAKNRKLDDVRADVRKAAVARLDQQVKDGEITQAQRDDMLEHLDEHLARLGQVPQDGPRGGGHGGHGGQGLDITRLPVPVTPTATKRPSP